MTDLWVWLIVLAGASLLFVVWPLLRFGKKNSVSDDKRNEINDRLYREQLTDIEKDFARGVIDEQQKQQLTADLERIHNSDLQNGDLPNDGLQGNGLKNNDLQNKGDRTVTAPHNSYNRFAVVSCLLAGLLVPLLAVGIYSWQGSAKDLEVDQLDQKIGDYVKANEFDETAKVMVQELREKLEARLASNPANMRNWYLLASIAYNQGDVKRSIEAYTKILEENPDAPGVLSNLVQVLFIASGNAFTDDSRKLLQRALSLDLNNHSLLVMGGLDAFEQGKFSDAISYWTQAMRLTPQGDERREQLQEFIAQARVRAMMTDGENSSADVVQQGANAQGNSVVAETADAVNGKAVTLKVALAEHVDAKPSDRVFIYARAWQGPPMPLAIVDITVAELPATVRLDNSKSMIEGMNLDRFPQIELVARISSTGRNTAMSGEWEATLGPISLSGSDQQESLTISERRP